MFSSALIASQLVLLSGLPSLSPDQAIVIQSEGLKAIQPQLASGGPGNFHLVVGSGQEVFHCSSKDAGGSFTEPVKVAAVKSLSLGMRRGPRVAALGDSIVVTLIGGEQGGGKDGDVLAWRSVDGKTWLGPVRVNDVSGSAREGLHAMAAGPTGQAFCVWLDLRNGKTEVMGAASNDGGETWGENRLIYRSPDGNVCECCHPSVTFAQDRSLMVMWRNWLGGNRDMYFATSPDGQMFSTATKLGNGAWPLKACPMDGGAIVARTANDLSSIWRRENEIYLTSGGSRKERGLGEGEQPWIAQADQGPVAVWLKRRGGELLIKLPAVEAPVALAAEARDPVCVAQGNVAVVAWEGSNSGQPAIFVRRVELGNDARSSK
jgi:hypothetical protein